MKGFYYVRIMRLEKRSLDNNEELLSKLKDFQINKKLLNYIIDCGYKTKQEIEDFLKYYGDIRPAAFLSYEREAYYEKNGGSFRVTFDDTILFRTTDMSLTANAYGEPLLDEGKVNKLLEDTGLEVKSRIRLI